MKKLNRKTIGLLAVSLLVVASVGVGSALAYFTAYTEANGAKEIVLEFSDTDVDEIIKNNAKHITLTNKEGKEVYVRVKALVGDKYESYIQYVSDEKWVPDTDGFVYYTDILGAGESTSEVQVAIDFEAIEALYSEDETIEEFNVIIVQECTPVLYDSEGEPYADWNVTADIVNNEVIEEDNVE